MAPYPVLRCGRCGRPTGWLDDGGRCAECLRAELLHHAYADPHGGWVGPPPLFLPEAERTPLPERAAALVGVRRAILRAWLQHVEPGETGPPAPRVGYELEVATKTEEPAPDASQLLVRFRSVRHRFDGDRWQPLVGSKLEPRTPEVFPADLEIVALAEAWSDFREEVAAFNRGAWAETAAREEGVRLRPEARRLEAEQQAERLRRGRGASGLLPD